MYTVLVIVAKNNDYHHELCMDFNKTATKIFDEATKFPKRKLLFEQTSLKLEDNKQKRIIVFDFSFRAV